MEESTLLHLKDRVIELKYTSFGEHIDVDKFTSIDYSNLYGEAVTVSALLNKIGLFRADAEEAWSESKLAADIFAATAKKQLRRQAAENSGKVKVEGEWLKLTENTVEELLLLNPAYEVMRKNIIKRKKDFDYVDSLFWAIKDKSSKLNNLLPKIVPEDFQKDIIAGEINGIMIRSHKKKYS